MEMLNLGIIGMSEGNGHPYSWSAIVNGYDKQSMERCGFETIPRYLEQHNMREEHIKNARVTHIWTQSVERTNHIAETTYINNKCENFEQMAGKIDGIIIARDDYENHMKHAEFFLKKGIPLYIDKPLATKVEDAESLLKKQVYKGQIFTCSALRYAKELIISEDELKTLGKIKKIRGESIKEWDKYAIHIIEPILNIPYAKQKYRYHAATRENKRNKLTIYYEKDFEVELETTGKNNGSIMIEIIGTNKKLIREFNDPFNSFKIALEKFIIAAESKIEVIPNDETLEIVKTIQMGAET